MRKINVRLRKEIEQVWFARMAAGYPADSIPPPPPGTTTAPVDINECRAVLNIRDGELYTWTGLWWGRVYQWRKTNKLKGHLNQFVRVYDSTGCSWGGIVTDDRAVLWRGLKPERHRPVWFGPRHMCPKTHFMPPGYAEVPARSGSVTQHINKVVDDRKKHPEKYVDF